ncbi:hypothetical protein [Luteipulveratus mongoliensis]|uniref:Uncharacterized protein n=1 Tax=Luteipulveratus mongoliensis TaxID=571913 RepID=A0A0K1JMN2_9MICO|nr:hypothetical protein [Luteipulveratus mongoliensis]AKU17838.1 hypothetical protein VV02_21540 [Luteipulveratus mongoliensis]
MRPPVATVPRPPGRIGAPVPAQEMLGYLTALGAWRDARREELDNLDRAALQSPDEDTFSADLVLSMAVWKSVSDRYELLLVTWDSGRVGQAESERLSTLIWGGLDTGSGAAGALAVSLPEACALSDALAGSLRARLAIDPDQADLADRQRDLRAQVERVRDLVDREPATARAAAEQTLQDLSRRVTEITERAGRGADVGGLLGPLEIDAARTERDLIVASSTRREQAADVAQARTLRTQLEAEGVAVQAVAAQCIAGVTPAPRLAVPDVTALGPVPNTAAELTTYLSRLDAVRRALSQAHAAYGTALQRRDELSGRLDAYRVKAGPELSPDLAELYQRAQTLLAQPPVDLVRLGALTSAYQAYLETILAAHPQPRRAPEGVS